MAYVTHYQIPHFLNFQKQRRILRTCFDICGTQGRYFDCQTLTCIKKTTALIYDKLLHQGPPKQMQMLLLEMKDDLARQLQALEVRSGVMHAS